MNDFPHRLFSSTVLLMTCMFLSKGAAQETVSFSKTTSTSTTTTTSAENNNALATIIVASVVSGSVVLIALIVTAGVVVAKRRRAALRKDENSPVDFIDNSRVYETLDVRRCANSNPHAFTNESRYDYEISCAPRPDPIMTIKFPSEGSTGGQSVLPPPYGDENAYVSVG